MRTICKEGSEPPSLTAWKKANPHKCYADLDRDIRQDIRDHVLKEQFYLCAYCCQKILDISVCHNEHVEAQRLKPKRTLDLTNIVASCNTKEQCGNSHEDKALNLTPLMMECETKLQFKISGRVKGLSDRAIDTIEVLNLGDNERNNRKLIEKRKQLSDALLWKNRINPDDGPELEDKEALESLIEELSKPQDGQLESFAPVLINILRSWLQT